MDHAVKLAALAVREVELCTHLYQTLLGELFADGLALSQSSRDFFEKIDHPGFGVLKTRNLVCPRKYLPCA
jgi:hypothetical protein